MEVQDYQGWTLKSGRGCLNQLNFEKLHLIFGTFNSVDRIAFLCDVKIICQSIAQYVKLHGT